MPNTYRTPTVTSIGGRDGSIRSADGLLDLQVAVAQEIGGRGGRTNPAELFAAPDRDPPAHSSRKRR
jgi:osmotically inducible protein OsmC